MHSAASTCEHGAAASRGRAHSGLCLRGGAEELVTGLLARSACLGADAAVRHVHPLSVSLALVAAASARLRASFEQPPGHLRIGAHLPRKGATRRLADIGAVEVEPDAARQLLDLVLAETRVCARGTRLRTVEAGVDTAGERGSIELNLRRCRLEHLPGMGHGFPSPLGGQNDIWITVQIRV